MADGDEVELVDVNVAVVFVGEPTALGDIFTQEERGDDKSAVVVVVAVVVAVVAVAVAVAIAVVVVVAVVVAPASGNTGNSSSHLLVLAFPKIFLVID